MKADVFDGQNNKVDEIELSDKIFNVKWNPDLVHQALLAQLANRRQTLAHAKGRGEVSGGGKKPWRQKGTGRARHGSIRSPIWIGGGVTHGPLKEKKYAKKINKKMKKLAIFSVLSKKLNAQEIKIIDKFDAIKKTNEWRKILGNLVDLRLSVLLIPAASNNISKASGNIKKVNAVSSKSLNVYDLVNAKNIILEKEAIKEIEKHYI
jgi:large subunit ribosomal protein L4